MLQGRTPLQTRLPPAAAAARLEQLQQLRLEAGAAARLETGRRHAAGQGAADAAAAAGAKPAGAPWPAAEWPPTAHGAEGGGRRLGGDASATGATSDEVTSLDEGGSTHGAGEGSNPSSTAGEQTPPPEAVGAVVAAVVHGAAKGTHPAAGLVSAEALEEARARGRRRAFERARARVNEHRGTSDGARAPA